MKLIDANVLDKIILEEASFKTKQSYNNNSLAEARGLIKAHDIITNQPVVEAIVYCKDCKYEKECWTCHEELGLNGFCSQGKLKGEM